MEEKQNNNSCSGVWAASLGGKWAKDCYQLFFPTYLLPHHQCQQKRGDAVGYDKCRGCLNPDVQAIIFLGYLWRVTIKQVVCIPCLFLHTTYFFFFKIHVRMPVEDSVTSPQLITTTNRFLICHLTGVWPQPSKCKQRIFIFLLVDKDTGIQEAKLSSIRPCIYILLELENLT